MKNLSAKTKVAQAVIADIDDYLDYYKKNEGRQAFPNHIDQ